MEYQLEALKRCPRTKHHLEQYLHSLPKNLDETYERILCSIDEDYIDDARHILTLLCFAKRPMTVPELADAYSINPQTFQPDPDRRGLDIDSMRELCPGLIDIVSVEDNEKEDWVEDAVRIAHSSIREYLLSNHIGQSKAASFGIQHGTGHKLLAHMFLLYIQQPELCRGELDERKLEEFPLARLAAESWLHHYKEAGRALDTAASGLKPQLFIRQLDSFRTWTQLYDVDKIWRNKLHQPDSPQLPSPMYCASFLDLTSVVLDLFIQTITDPGNCKVRDPPDTLLGHGGRLGNSLQAACWNGNELIVGMLLGHDVNTTGGWCGNALQAASYNGHQSIVCILLENGADVNAVGGKYHTALQAASHNGHNALVCELLDRGADINAQDSKLGDALQIASSNGHRTVVFTLIERGADVNRQGGLYGNALQAASVAGNDEIVQILLDNGASINTQGGKFDNALQAAAIRRNEDVVRIILDRGADINAPCRLLGTILAAAACGGNANIVRMLLNKGADVNVQGTGTWNNALQTASVRGHEEVVRLLLDRGADVQAHGGEYGTALQAAARHGHERIVQMLLGEGADVYARGGRFRNAIEAASHGGFEHVVFILKVAGAESIAG